MENSNTDPESQQECPQEEQPTKAASSLFFEEKPRGTGLAVLIGVSLPIVVWLFPSGPDNSEAVSSKSTSSEIRKLDLRDGDSGLVVTGADHRAISFARHTFRTDGQIRKYDTPIDVICAEPNPDTTNDVSAASSTTQKAGGGPAGLRSEIVRGGVGNYSRKARQLLRRSDSVQLLRDGMYRTCEAYQNHAIGGREFYFLANKYANIMVTLLAIERLSDHVGPQPSTGRDEESIGGDDSVEVSERAKEESDDAAVDEGITARDEHTDSSVPAAIAKLVDSITSQDRANRILQFCLDAVDPVARIRQVAAKPALESADIRLTRPDAASAGPKDSETVRGTATGGGDAVLRRLCFAALFSPDKAGELVNELNEGQQETLSNFLFQGEREAAPETTTLPSNVEELQSISIDAPALVFSGEEGTQGRGRFVRFRLDGAETDTLLFAKGKNFDPVMQLYRIQLDGDQITSGALVDDSDDHELGAAWGSVLGLAPADSAIRAVLPSADYLVHVKRYDRGSVNGITLQVVRAGKQFDTLVAETPALSIGTFSNVELNENQARFGDQIHVEPVGKPVQLEVRTKPSRRYALSVRGEGNNEFQAYVLETTNGGSEVRAEQSWYLPYESATESSPLVWFAEKDSARIVFNTPVGSYAKATVSVTEASNAAVARRIAPAPAENTEGEDPATE